MTLSTHHPKAQDRVNFPTDPQRRSTMTEKLVQGDRFPKIELDLIDGSTMSLPRDIPGRYLALLFYRGEW